MGTCIYVSTDVEHPSSRVPNLLVIILGSLICWFALELAPKFVKGILFQRHIQELVRVNGKARMKKF